MKFTRSPNDTNGTNDWSVINEDANTRLIRKLKEEILMLREQLAQVLVPISI